MHRWYVLHTKPRHERLVAAQLRQHQLEYYLPLLHVKPVNPRAARERPYFPGYLFLRIDLDAITWAGLRWMPGLHRLVEFGGQPAVVPDALVTEIQRRLESIVAAGSLVNLQPGDRLEIVSGPLAGYTALFDARLSSGGRVRILLELLQQHSGRPAAPRRLPVEINAAALRRAVPKPM